MTIEQLYQIYLAHPSIQTDTRKIQKDDFFFALKGPNFNGNAFAQQALEAGAAYAVIDEASPIQNDRLIVVKDTLTTLQDIAKFHRLQFDIPFIAITGSNGKTTTKELIHVVLSTVFKTYTTEGNLNNHIGIPLTILKVKKDAEIAVIEMGANHQKEIESYCNYTLPTHGLITNCGKAHLEGFGGEAGVRKGKGELFDYLRAHHGTAFIMKDFDYLKEMVRGVSNIISYGTKDAGTMGYATKSEPFLDVQLSGSSKALLHTQLVGAYNLPNILAAIAIGHYFKVPEEKMISALENYTPSNSRSQLIENGTNKIILDAYNANPSSMKAAIENMAQLPATNKVLLLGAMAELGQESLQEHQGIVDLINQYPWSKVVLVGGDFMKLQHPFISLTNAEAARDWFQQQHFNHSHILIKGSRSMQMEKVLAA